MATVPRTGPSVIVPTPEDLEVAKSDALLQLRIGRSAHYYSVLVAGALLFDGFLVLLIQPNLTSVEPPRLQKLFFLIFPLGSGLYLSVLGLRVKWEVYQLWPWEPHFSLTVASVALNVALAILYFTDLFHYGPTGGWNLLPWFYPLTLLGVSLPLVALGLTWQNWIPQKTTSLVAAILPVPVALALFIPASSSTTTNLLMATLFASAAFYQMSGSFLHLISSGTRVHERELITSGQSRMFRLADELRQKEEALRFREATLLKREADAEDADDSLLRQRQALEEGRAQFTTIESDLKTRSESVSAEQQAWAVKVAEINALGHQIEDQKASIAMREQDVESRLPRLSEREHTILQRESELTRREVDLTQRDHELQRRLSSVPELEARLEARRQDLEHRTTEMLQKESEIRSREATVDMTATERSGAQSKLKGVEERETRLNQLKLVLDEQNVTLGRRSRQLDESLADAKRQAEGAGQREVAISERERSIKQRESDASDKLELATQRQQQYEEALRRYEDRVRLVETKEATVGTRSGEIDRKLSGLSQRESSVQLREEAITKLRTTIDRAHRELLERERSVQAREAEVALKRQELSRASAPWSEDRLSLDARERALRERESRLARKEYVAATPAQAGDGLLAPPVAKRLAGRIPTGTPRLDDLLLGGIPPKAHVLLVGPPFIGKEILLYSFIVEGLKRGEPAVLITASRTPEELAPEIGVISPQLREYEQMGQVRWIDASSPTPSGASKDPSRVSVRGPSDHAGILSALVQESKAMEAKGVPLFRVGFLGLSACLAHGEPRAGFSFVQNLVGILKPRNAVASYAVDAGTLPESQLETIQTRMDGSVQFKQERGKTFLSVLGLGEVQTRDWVEYRATNRALLIGSFALERIR